MMRVAWLVSAVLVSGCAALQAKTPPALPSGAAIDAEVTHMMATTGAKGFALAVIDGGVVKKVSVYGARNAAGDPLKTDSIMYAASLTKMTFGYMVAQLADDGLLDLDKSIADYLPLPLPAYSDEKTADAYAAWGGLAGDDRWKTLTPRILLNHGSGFANFGFLEPDEKLDVVAFGEALDEAVTMLISALDQIVCHASVKRAAKLAREDVDPIAHIRPCDGKMDPGARCARPG